MPAKMPAMMPPKPIRAAIYCRVSTDRQVGPDKGSMDDQLARCYALAETKGWHVVEVFDEGDASAGSASRPEFQRMIAAAEAEQFEVIIVRELSRLSREKTARLAIETLCIDWEITVANARTGMTFGKQSNLGAGIMWAVESEMAEAELAERSFRTTMGMTSKAERGLVPGAKAPYGYRWCSGSVESCRQEPQPASDKPRIHIPPHPPALEIHEEEAEVVERIFRELSVGRTCAHVARMLNADRVVSPGMIAFLKAPKTRGGRSKTPPAGLWTPATIYDIGTRGAYVGSHSWGKTHWVRLNSEKDKRAWVRKYAERHGVEPEVTPKKVRVPGEKVYTVTTPRILDDALFKRVQRRMTGLRKGAKVARRTPMLLGLLRCEECGREMRVTWAKGRGGAEYHFYRCAMHQRNPERFPCRASDRELGTTAYVSAPEIEGLVWGLIDGMLADRETLERAVGLRLAEDEAREPSAADRLARTEKRLVDMQNAIKRVRHAYFVSELINEEVYREETAHFEREIESLKGEVDRMSAAAEQRRRQRDRAVLLTQVVDRWPEIRAEMTEEERRKLVWELVRDVTVSKHDEVTIAGNLSPLATTVPAGVSTEKGTGGRYWIRTSDLVDVNDAL